MAFLIYERLQARGGSFVLRPTGGKFRLAGYNLLFKAWEARSQPLDQGWHVTADELVRIQSNGNHSNDTRRLLIDYAPRSRNKIGVIELLDVYAYTHAYGSGKPEWTPLMLRMRKVHDSTYQTPLTEQQKAATMSNLPEPTDESDFLEFLYLNRSWNWGPSGKTNAAFLERDARAYFRKFF